MTIDEHELTRRFESFVRLAAAGRGNPRFVRDLCHQEVDERFAPVPAEGERLVDYLLQKALVAVRYDDDEEARAFIARAFRAPPGEGATEPFVLGRALRWLGSEMFRAARLTGVDGEWFGALRGGLRRPGDDISLVCLSCMQALARVHPLDPWQAEVVAECFEEFAGTDPRPFLERVLAGGSHEPDLVLEVLEVGQLIQECAEDQYEREREREEDEPAADDR